MNNTTSILDNIYPIVEKKLNEKKTMEAYKNMLNKFMEYRSNDLYDIAPCSRLYFGEQDKDNYFKVFNISDLEIKEYIDKTYYGVIDNFNPRAAKDELTVMQLCVIRYFIEKNDKKQTDLACIYLSFSGKFYPSIHYRSYPKVAPIRHVMEFVVNSKLSKKFDLVQTGSILGSIQSIDKTWISSYSQKFKKFSDEDVVYLIQQLHSRIGSFMKNIADEYYKIYNEKDKYITFDSDSLDQDDYHLADSDSLRMQRAVEKAINTINNTGIDYSICKMSADQNVKPSELRAIIESIINDRNNLAKVRRLIELLITTYYANSTAKNKDVADISFITYSIATKPNARQKEIVEIKNIVQSFLEENSPAYMRRRSRIATKNSYESAIIKYFTFLIHNANR